MFVYEKGIFRKLLFKLFCICLTLEKLISRKHSPVKGKFDLVSRKIWTENTFQKLWKKLEKLYYLLTVSNLILKLLIAIYILFWIFIFQFHLLKFNFYINFDPHFYNFYLLYPYYFFIKIFYLSNLVLILLIIIYFI